MLTECNTREFHFQGLGSRAVSARFDGGAITSDAGGLLLREVEAKTGIIRRLAACFDDHRDPELIEHTVYDLWRSAFLPWLWATKTSMTTIPFATIRCWRCWSASRTRRGKSVAAHGIGASRWQARAR